MAFDPDAYLASKQVSPVANEGFDPDAYLASKKPVAQTPAPTAAPQINQGFGANAIGAVLEPVLTMGTGMLAKPISDIAGLAATGKEMISPTPGGGDPEAFKRYVQERLTYVPRTTSGRAVTEYNPLSLVGKGVNWVGEKAGELAGSQGRNPSFGRGVQEAVTQVPQLLGMKYAKATEAKLPSEQSALDIARGENLPKDMIRSQSQGVGLTTPVEGTSWLAGIAGIGKVDKWISAGNEPKFNRLVAENFGIPKGVALTVDELKLVRENSGKAYRAVVAAGDAMRQSVSAPSAFVDASEKPIVPSTMKQGFKVDPEFDNSMKTMVKQIGALQEELPATFKASDASLKILGDYVDKKSLTPATTITAIRQLRKDAATEFKSDDPEKMASAFTRKEIADKLEDLIERNLQRTGQTDLLTQYRAARTTIAQTYDVQAALDNTGNVNARKLYSLSQKKPGVFTGNLKILADYAGAFPEGAQKVASGKQALGPWDWLIGGAGVASGSAKHLADAAMLIGGRVAVPKLAQKGLLQKKTPNYKATNKLGKVAVPSGILTSEEAQRGPPQ